VTQNEELARVKERIRKMASMTISAGASEAEANFAMIKVGELLDQYNLSMSEIEVRAENCIPMVCGTGKLKLAQHAVFTFSLARFCNVKCWSQKRPKEWTFVFFGLESDVQMASYLFQVIDRAMATEVTRYKQTAEYKFADVHRKRLSNSFQNGFAYRIHERLWKLAAQAEQARAANPVVSSSTALVIVAKEQHIEEEFKKTGTKLRMRYNATRTTEYGSANAGRAAGDKVNLGRPVEGNTGRSIK
jgi:uncharacterized membrane protein